MKTESYKKPTMKVIALCQENHLLGSSDPTTNEVNATRDNYMGGVAWQWS